MIRLYRRYLQGKLAQVRERIMEQEGALINNKARYEERLDMIHNKSEKSGGTVSFGLVYLASVSNRGIGEIERELGRLKSTEERLSSKLSKHLSEKEF